MVGGVPGAFIIVKVFEVIGWVVLVCRVSVRVYGFSVGKHIYPFYICKL